jgi:hypothetical protein
MNRALGRKIRDITGPLFPPMYFLYLLVDDLNSVMFFPRWIRSFFVPLPNAVRDGIPWLPFQLIAWLEASLSKNANVFEYGSGGSTIFLAQRVKSLCTVEHDRKWHELVASELKRRQFTNVQYLLREPESTGPNPPAEYWDNYGNEYPNKSFERYVKAINEHPDHSLDLVLVDGRARKFCLEHAIKKIHPGGYLVLDNSSTREYLDFLVPLRKYPRFDITSISPFWPPSKWQSSVWQMQDGA